MVSWGDEIDCEVRLTQSQNYTKNEKETSDVSSGQCVCVRVILSNNSNVVWIGIEKALRIVNTIKILLTKCIDCPHRCVYVCVRERESRMYSNS